MKEWGLGRTSGTVGLMPLSHGCAPATRCHVIGKRWPSVAFHMPLPSFRRANHFISTWRTASTQYSRAPSHQPKIKQIETRTVGRGQPGCLLCAEGYGRKAGKDQRRVSRTTTIMGSISDDHMWCSIICNIV